MESCIFCEIAGGEQAEEVLFTSPNFFVKPAAFGAFGPGHVLLISKSHLSCYGALPPNLDSEFQEIQQKTQERLEDNFSQPFSFELGVYMQTIKHAHTHFFPSKAEHYNIVNIEKLLMQASTITKTSIHDLDGLRSIFEREGEYVSLGYTDQSYVLHTKSYEGQPVRGRDLFVRATGLTELLDWKKMPQEFQERNEEWIKQTIDALKE